MKGQVKEFIQVRKYELQGRIGEKFSRTIMVIGVIGYLAKGIFSRKRTK